MKFLMMALGATLAVGAVLATPASAKETTFQVHTTKPGGSCLDACALSPASSGLAGTLSATPAQSGPMRVCTCKMSALAVGGLGGTLIGGSNGTSTAAGATTTTVLSIGADGVATAIDAPKLGAAAAKVDAAKLGTAKVDASRLGASKTDAVKANTLLGQ